HVDKVARAHGVEDKRFRSALRRPEVHAVAPNEGKRISQKETERTGRLGPFQDSKHKRVLGADQPIVRRYFLAMPVAPARRRTDRLRFAGEVLWPGHQAVGLAESVGRDFVAPNVLLVGVSGRQGAAAEKSPFAVASGA